MVTIVEYKERVNLKGEPFNALVIEGEMELIKSESGRFYATARRTSIPSSFTEETCQRLIGKQIPGAIVKVECERTQTYQRIGRREPPAQAIGG
jgi:hypothetical protein